MMEKMCPLTMMRYIFLRKPKKVLGFDVWNMRLFPNSV